MPAVLLPSSVYCCGVGVTQSYDKILDECRFAVSQKQAVQQNCFIFTLDEIINVTPQQKWWCQSDPPPTESILILNMCSDLVHASFAPLSPVDQQE